MGFRSMKNLEYIIPGPVTFFLINIANHDLKIDILLLIQTKLYPGFRRSLTSKRRHKMHVIQNAKKKKKKKYFQLLY